MAQVQAVFEQHSNFYGTQRIRHELRTKGLMVGRQNVGRLMRTTALKYKKCRGFRPCRKRDSNLSGVADKLQQKEFRPADPNRCWAGNITYIHKTAGWHYLAVCIDLYRRRVIGWAVEARIEDTLMLKALNRAMRHRHFDPNQLLIQTDQGSEYRTSALRRRLEGRKISCCMSGNGCSLNDAMVESLSSSRKHELKLDDNTATLNSLEQLIRNLTY
jgi:putative transposase